MKNRWTIPFVFAVVVMTSAGCDSVCDALCGNRPRPTTEPPDTVIPEPGDTVIVEPGDTVIIEPGDTVVVEPGDSTETSRVARRFRMDPTGVLLLPRR